MWFRIIRRGRRPVVESGGRDVRRRERGGDGGMEVVERTECIVEVVCVERVRRREYIGVVESAEGGCVVSVALRHPDDGLHTYSSAALGRDGMFTFRVERGMGRVSRVVGIRV